MLQSVFVEQWRNPSKNDWTTEVQKDMVEFNLGQDWSKIKGVSYKVFAARIDEMGRKLEFSKLSRNLKYPQLNIINSSLRNI